MENVEQIVSLPRLGEKAPEFTAPTTHGEISLSDYKGKWLILFSHPADFTPVCTTEFIGFANIHEELRKMNTELIGLSIDSVFSHIAWVRNIEEKFGVKIDFPVIADLSKDVATKFGMIHPGQSDTATSRCVFIMDPEGVVRAMIYYPLSTGRNMDEILRTIQALQATDANGVATPANWRPGDQVIVPPPATQKAAEERVKTPGLDVTDWYFSKKSL